VPLVEVGFLTGLRASNPIDIRWGDKDGKDGAFQGENGSYQEMFWCRGSGPIMGQTDTVVNGRCWKVVIESRG
jgi:hypothetical protein